MFSERITPYEIALDEMSAFGTAELLGELDSCISNLEFKSRRAHYIQEELKSLESTQRGSERFNHHVENIRRGLRYFDCVDTADQANAILDLLSQNNTKEPIGSWEY